MTRKRLAEYVVNDIADRRWSHLLRGGMDWKGVVE
jgi:hypothetical protein